MTRTTRLFRKLTGASLLLALAAVAPYVVHALMQR